MGTKVHNNLSKFLKEIDDCKVFNPLNAELNFICHLLALLGAHHIFHVSRLSVKKELKLFLLFHAFYSVEEFVSF
jgi:hypothetical protein